MGVILVVPALRTVFSIPVLPMGNLLEAIGLIFAPLLVVEIMKLAKVNTAKDE